MEGCDLPDYDPANYGDRMAEVYDEWFGTPADAEEAVAFLSDLAGQGRVLELGIGTGRIALPHDCQQVREEAVPGFGIERFMRLVEQLERHVSRRIPVTRRDLAPEGAQADSAGRNILRAGRKIMLVEDDSEDRATA